MVESSSLTEKIWPPIEKILSTEVDESGIDICFFAKIVLESAQSID